MTQVLLASQILQKLVKSMPNKITSESLAYIRKYVETLGSCREKVIDMESEEDKVAVDWLFSIVDWSMPPERVKTACDVTKDQQPTDKQHWIVSAFMLEKGKKIVEAARQNAVRREASSSIIEEITEKSGKIQNMGLLTSDSIHMKNKFSFDRDYGDLVKQAHRTSTSPAAKLLKGEDKETVTDLQTMVYDAVHVIMTAFIEFDLIPFFDQVALAMTSNDPKALPSSCMPTETNSCIFHVQGTTSKKRVKALVDAGQEYTDLASRFMQMLKGKLTAHESKQTMEDWNECTTKLLTEFGDDDVRGLKNAAGGVYSAAQKALEKTVSTEASQHVFDCITFAVNLITGKLDPLSEDMVVQFDKNSEQASFMSTAMDKGPGGHIRNGLDILGKIVHSEINFQTNRKDRQTVPLAELFSNVDCLALVLKLKDGKIDEALNEMVKSTPHQSQSPSVSAGEVSVISSHVSSLVKEGEEIQALLVEGFKKAFNNISIPELDIPDHIFDLDKDNLKKAFEMHESVNKTFSPSVTKKVSKAAAELEDLLNTVSEIGKSLGISDFLDTNEYRKQWLSCLTWLCLGWLNFYFLGLFKFCFFVS